MTPGDFEIRALTSSDHDDYHRVRLAGLEECPWAFATGAEEWRSAGREVIDGHLRSSESGPDAPILGALSTADGLVGLLGMRRDPRPSVRHKASLWGLYVLPPWRRQGVARVMLSEMITVAGTVDGLRQLRATVPVTGGALAVFEQAGFARFGIEVDAKQVDGRFYDQAYVWLRVGER